MTLQELIEHLHRLHGPRNGLLGHGRMHGIGILEESIGELQDVIRKASKDRRRVGDALAAVIVRIVAIVDGCNPHVLVSEMARKYPLDCCSYCGKKPCACVERRPEPMLAMVPNSRQLQWTLSDWAAHVDALYGDKNKERGIENILNRLFKEVVEIQKLQRKIHAAVGTLTRIEEEFAHEFADALSWTCAVANWFNIDPEAFVLARYGVRCLHCGHNPCDCPQKPMSDPLTPPP